MDNSLIVFREENIYLGLLLNDFEQHFSLNHVWISPSMQSPLIWKFETKQKPFEGNFVHLGILLGFSPAYFNHSGHIFLKKIHDFSFMGIFMNNFFLQIPFAKFRDKKLDISEVKNYPLNVPKNTFRFVHRFKRKNIFVIDPLLLFQTYNVLPPTNAS